MRNLNRLSETNSKFFMEKFEWVGPKIKQAGIQSNSETIEKLEQLDKEKSLLVNTNILRQLVRRKRHDLEFDSYKSISKSEVEDKGYQLLPPPPPSHRQIENILTTDSCKKDGSIIWQKQTKIQVKLIILGEINSN